MYMRVLAKSVFVCCTDAMSVDTIPVTDNEGSTASAPAATVATTSATVASSALPRILSSEVYSAPQTAALRYLVSVQVFTVFFSDVLQPWNR